MAKFSQVRNISPGELWTAKILTPTSFKKLSALEEMLISFRLRKRGFHPDRILILSELLDSDYVEYLDLEKQEKKFIHWQSLVMYYKKEQD